MAALDNVDVDTIDNCLVPEFRKNELPDSKYSVLRNLLHKYKAAPFLGGQIMHTITFQLQDHWSVYHQDEFQSILEQLQTMLELGIIEKSNSPWMAPAVFVPKSRGKYECV